jgi:hypothetical protein
MDILPPWRSFIGVILAWHLAGLARAIIAESVIGRERLSKSPSIIKELKETHGYYLASASIVSLSEGRLLAVSKTVSFPGIVEILLFLSLVQLCLSHNHQPYPQPQRDVTSTAVANDACQEG